MILFGNVHEVRTPSVRWREFTFSPAEISFRKLSNGCHPSTPSLAKQAGERVEGILPDCEFDAPWARGRIQRLFAMQQDPSLTVGVTIGSHSDKRFNDRNCMHFSFVGNTVFNDLDLSVPFNCTEGFGRSRLQFGSIQTRNASTYALLINRMAVAFWELLLEDPNDIEEYVDRGSICETIFEFGVRSGRPFFGWVES